MEEKKKEAWFRTIGGSWGLGVPVTWQGWLVVATYFGLGVAAFVNGLRGYYIIALIAAFLIVRHFKSERPPR